MENGREETPRGQSPHHSRAFCGPQAERRELILVFGRTGTGKSSWLREVYVKGHHRVLVFNPLLEESIPGVEDVESIEVLIDLMTLHRVFAYRFTGYATVDQICLIAYTVGNLTLILEESQRFLPPHTKPPESCLDIVFRGRHRSVSMVLVSQRPTSINIDIRSQWTRIIVFQQIEPQDCEWVRSSTGQALPDLEGFTTGEYYEITPHAAVKCRLDKIYKMRDIKSTQTVTR